MSSSSKKRKNKWKTVAVEDILPNAIIRPTTSWAEEVESELNEYTIKKISSISLPTAPRATCDLVIDESKIPPNGPFMAYLSNLPYEITEDDITQQFKELKVASIQLPKDSRHDRMKGFGYVEFKDKSSLLTALNEGELTLKGRLVRISLPSEDEPNKDKGSRSGGVSFSRRDVSDRIEGSDRNLGEWRAAAPIPHDPEKAGFTRPGQSEGRPFREPRTFDPEPSSFTRGGFREHDRNSDGRRNDRGGNPFSKRYERDDREKRFDREDRGSRMGFGRRFEEREFRREPPPADKEEPKSRPKLDIQPRTKPIEQNVPESLPSSIFGGAKPVDTLKREMEIEAKLSNLAAMQSSARSRGSTPPPRSITPVSNRSRSSSVSSRSSCRRQDIDVTESANDSQANQSDTESKEQSFSKIEPAKPEFKEPPLKNVWEQRKAASAAAAAESTAPDSPSSVIEKANVYENSVDVNVETRSQSEDASKSTAGEERRSADRSSSSADYKNENTRPSTDKDCNSDDGFIRFEPDHYTNPDTPQQSRGTGRYNDSKFNFRNNRGRDRPDNRRRPDNGQYGGRSENAYGKWNSRNRNGPRNRDNGYFRDNRNADSGSNFSNRSSCSSSSTNLRDDDRPERYDRKHDERLIDDNASADVRREDESYKDAADERLKIVSDDNANKKTVENGNENGVDSEDVASKSNESIAVNSEQSELNDNSFSSSKSRKRDKKKKQDKKDNVEPEHDKQKNQKDDKKRSVDNHQTNDKANKNNVKNKDKPSKKNRESRRDDDVSQMPKAKEEKAPNFQDSNRFSFLNNDD